MVKRRRERDRPKCGPESLYNPNKRVLLSYADEDEEEDPHEDECIPTDATLSSIPGAALNILPNVQEPAETLRLDVADAVVAVPADVTGNRSMNAASDTTGTKSALERSDRDEEEVTSPLHGEKALHDAENGKVEQDYHKRSAARPRLDNQGLGCMQVFDEDDEYGGYDDEVAQYMRSVQLQRQGIPEIISMAHTTDDQPDSLDGQYEYEDGAFVHRQSPAIAREDKLTDPQLVFTKSLVARFRNQRAQLNCPPTAAELAQLGDELPISFPRTNKKARKEWLHIMSTRAPQLQHLRCLDNNVALNLLELIAWQGLAKKTNITALMSAWIWALLARLEDVADMCNDEIYPLRQLGKQSLYVQLSFTHPEAAAGIEALDDTAPPDSPRPAANLSNGHETNEGAEPLSVNVSGEKQDFTLTDNTLATIDMIITIVGEVFGQKDLLEFRQQWWQVAS